MISLSYLRYLGDT